MIRKIFFAVVIMSPVLVFAGDTTLNLYRPFTETTKHVPVTIESTQKGYCKQQSERIKREDAWHCVSEGGVIHDPCFSKRFGSNNRVVCPQSPWIGKSVQLTLDKPLDDHDMVPLDMSRTLPWAIELKNGEHCLSVAPHQTSDGLTVNYQCRNGSELVGDAHRCSPVWTILRQDSSVISMVELSGVWF